MANLGMIFDPDQAPENEYEDLTPGVYAMSIVESEIRETASGTGEGLNLTFEIIDGPSQGRRHWEWLNIRHQNPEAEKIAHATLGSICRAAGTGPVQDSTELHGIPMMVTLALKKNKKTGETQLRATKFAPFNQAPPSHQPAYHQPQQATAQMAAPQVAAAAAPAMPTNGQRRWGNR